MPQLRRCKNPKYLRIRFHHPWQTPQALAESRKQCHGVRERHEQGHYFALIQPQVWPSGCRIGINYGIFHPLAQDKHSHSTQIAESHN